MQRDKEMELDSMQSLTENMRNLLRQQLERDVDRHRSIARLRSDGDGDGDLESDAEAEIQRVRARRRELEQTLRR